MTLPDEVLKTDVFGRVRIKKARRDALLNEFERGAILYTLIESCQRRGLDPHAYLREVLTLLPSMTNWQVKDITPAAWAKSLRPTAVA